MTDASGRYTIVFNGEIYNHMDVRKDLPEYRFSTTCDTETILAAYARWGCHFVDRINGMFALAIWDRTKQELLLIRDRLGVKPLYFSESGNEFTFASEIGTLLYSGVVNRELDAQAIEAYLAFGAVQEPHTILRGVRILPAGHWMRVDGYGRVTSTGCYWSVLPHFRNKHPYKNVTEAQEEIRHALMEAIDLRLLSDVPLGAFLSGGIDSSVVVGIMASLGPGRHRTFCLDFDEGQYREGSFAREVAAEFGCEHHATVVQPHDLLEQMDKAFRHMDQPTVDGMNSYFVSGVARKNGVTVALSGQGGDEVFGGYPSFRQVPKCLGIAGWPGPMVRATSGVLRALARPTNRWNKIRGFLESGDYSPHNAYAYVRSVFWDQIRLNIFPTSGVSRAKTWVEYSVPRSDLACDPIDQVSQFELSSYLRNTLLRDLDVFSMAHSLEVRVPLIDYRLLETVARVNAQWKMARQVNKPLLVGTLCGRLPQRIVQRPKGLFWFPWDQWIHRDLKPQIAEVLLCSETDAIGLRPKAVRDLWERYLSCRGLVHWTQIWAMYVLVRWCRERHISLTAV